MKVREIIVESTQVSELDLIKKVMNGLKHAAVEIKQNPEEIKNMDAEDFDAIQNQVLDEDWKSALGKAALAGVIGLTGLSAQADQELGVKLAQCSGALLATSAMQANMGNVKSSNDYAEVGMIAFKLAEKHIGKAQTDKIGGKVIQDVKTAVLSNNVNAAKLWGNFAVECVKGLDTIVNGTQYSQQQAQQQAQPQQPQVLQLNKKLNSDDAIDYMRRNFAEEMGAMKAATDNDPTLDPKIKATVDDLYKRFGNRISQYQNDFNDAYGTMKGNMRGGKNSYYYQTQRAEVANWVSYLTDRTVRMEQFKAAVAKGDARGANAIYQSYMKEYGPGD